MHISEGVLSAPVLIGGGAAALAGVAIGTAKLDDRNTVPTAVTASALFVATLIRVPVGPSAVHLILNGLAGVLLGWRVFPAFAIALLLQALLFGAGGFSTLGVNVVIMALPGLAAYGIYRPIAHRWGDKGVFWGGCAAGASAILLGGLLLATALVSTGREFTAVAGLVAAAHLPVMAIEAVVTGATLRFLKRVRPEVLPRAGEVAITETDVLPEHPG